MEPIIKVDNVSMCFNLSKEKHESLKEYFLAMVQGRLQYDEFYALKDVSLDIMPGDFYGLVGLNGSGKSTLLKTIAGVYKPSKGKVTPPSDYSGYEYEHRNHVNRFYNSSAPVCVLQTGAFCRYRGCFYCPRAPPFA